MTREEVEFGAQNERTALAWHRTALAMLTMAAVLARLMFDRIGIVGLGTVIAGIAVTAWMFLASRAQYEGHAAIRPGYRARDGRTGAALTGLILVFATTELIALLT
ncbi:DUF202 domain-containing protein [Rhodococcus fascians]|nr:DUF202 domain-containing protein [Rhodococcus fascians]